MAAAFRNFSRALAGLGPIPRIVHVTSPQRFDPTTATAALIRDGLGNLLRRNPSWQALVYDDGDLDEDLRAWLAPPDYALIARAHPVEKADLWRLVKMYTMGGIYSDLDRLANVNLDTLLHPDTRCVLPLFVSANGAPGAWKDFTQNFMVSSPGNPIFLHAANLNVQRRAACHQAVVSAARGSSALPCVPKELFHCKMNIMGLGPTTFMHAASEVMFGAQVRRAPSLSQCRRMTRRMAELAPMLVVVAERPPLNTTTFQRSAVDASVLGVAPTATDWPAKVVRALDEAKRAFFATNSKRGYQHWYAALPSWRLAPPGPGPGPGLEPEAAPGFSGELAKGTDVRSS